MLSISIQRKNKSMPEAKFALIIMQMLGWCTYGYAIFETWGDVRSFLLFLVGFAFLIIKVADKVVDFKKKRLIMMNISEKQLDSVRGTKMRKATVIQIWHKTNTKSAQSS